jgi:L-ascorbate metabolism protein UlaG (beta-lactamase superfamily)
MQVSPTKITKYEHSCLDINDGSARLIVDPGMFSSSLTDFSKITALVITHVHPDHFDKQKVEAIIASNPDVMIFSTEEVSKELPSGRVTVPLIGQTYQVGSLAFEFFGGLHAAILSDSPSTQNFGVLVNDTFYYPGDSFTPCPKMHSALALPVMAPWLKLSEAVSFMETDNASHVFPVHDGFLNDAGQDLINRLLTPATEADGKTYHALKTNDFIEA